METMEIVRRAVPPCAIAACWLWETLVPARQPLALPRRRNAVNLAIGFSNAALAALAFSALMAILADWTAAKGWGALNLVNLPFYIRWPAILLFLDGFTYLWHFANHRSDWLWRFHQAHHSDHHLSATTAVRFHAGEIALSAGAKMALLPLLGFRLEELAAYETLLAAATAFHHANVSIGKWDAIVRWIVVTPDMHKIHHSIDPRQMNGNFATLLSLWDRCGGTFQRPDHTESLEFGVHELTDRKFHGFVGIWRTPLQRFSRAIRGLPGERPPS